MEFSKGWGFRSGAIAKVWTIEKDDTGISIRASISAKRKETGKYEQRWSGFIRMVGEEARRKAGKLDEGDRIQLGLVDVENRYDKEKKCTNTYYKCFTFSTMAELDDEQNYKDVPRATQEDFSVLDIEGDDDLPF